ncbi:MAG: serine protease [Gemmataceae bacterium]|nr:serine protease [Gemmata sp.]MDW8197766.1 serine protease [Gemmataceae bacterium]
MRWWVVIVGWGVVSWPALAAEIPLAACAWVRAENDTAGSGFLVDVDNRLLVTCRHVVAERKKVDVYFPWVTDGHLQTDRREYLRNRDWLREQKLLVTGTVQTTSDALDVAVLQLDHLPPQARAITWATQPAYVGETLAVVGNRLDVDTLWNRTTGPLRGAGRLAEGYFWRGQKLAVAAPVLIAQLPIEEGDSGGPVFNARGELVGMACALRRQCPLAAVVIAGEAIRRWMHPPEATPRHHPRPIVESLWRATVWVKPTATNRHLAGVLIDRDWVLTCAQGLQAGDRVGIAFPQRDRDQWVGERDAYGDPLTLHLHGFWRSGTILACDSQRDLALIRLDSTPAAMKPVSLATTLPQPGEEIHLMNHPGGLEFAWVYASGTVRQRGKLALQLGDQAKRVGVLVCQLPVQASSPGGPILNTRGQLVGILAAREGAQMVAYCATVEEIRIFLDVAGRYQPARTLAGWRARVASWLAQYPSRLARAIVYRAEEHRQAGRFEEAQRDCAAALALDARCIAARLCRVKMLPPADAMAELDTAIEKGPFHREVLLVRARAAAAAKDWRKARGDLERVLDVEPADAEARQLLIRVLLNLGDDTKAAAAVRDTLRADAKRLAAVAADLLAQSESLQKRFPDSPTIAADWLHRALEAAGQGISAQPVRMQIATLLQAASAAKTPADRLQILREGVQKLASD